MGILWQTKPQLFSAGAKVLAVGIAGYGTWHGVKVVRMGWSAIADIPVFLLLWCIIAALCYWVAWRLWRHWSAATVRHAVGLMAALLAIWAWGGYVWLLPARGDPSASPAHQLNVMAQTVLGLALLLVTALLYQRLSRAIIRWAELEDPLDLHGQPEGHAWRVRMFGQLLSVAVFIVILQAMVLAEALTLFDSDFMIVGFFGAILGGVGTYELVLWWMLPRTTEARPAGGFEVQAPSAEVVEPRELADRPPEARETALRSGERLS